MFTGSFERKPPVEGTASTRSRHAEAIGVRLRVLFIALLCLVAVGVVAFFFDHWGHDCHSGGFLSEDNDSGR